MSDSVRAWKRIPDTSDLQKVSVSIDSDLLERVDKLARQTNRSRSNIVREALRRTLPTSSD